MSQWFESKRLLVFLIALVATSAWGVGENAAWVPTPNTAAVTWLGVAYLAGQSLVDAVKAWRGK